MVSSVAAAAYQSDIAAYTLTQYSDFKEVQKGIYAYPYSSYKRSF